MIERTKRIWAMLPMEGKIELTVITFVFPLFVLWQMLSGRNWQDSATTYIFVLIAIYIAMLLASTERTKAAKTAEFYRKRIEQEQEMKNRLNNSPTEPRKKSVLMLDTPNQDDKDDFPREQQLLKADAEKKDASKVNNDLEEPREQAKKPKAKLVSKHRERDRHFDRGGFTR